ncbi:hypothetical protein MRX96_044307 [Rhipicephalus microplus]
MSHASRFCISQALVTLLLLPFSPMILTATDNPVPLPPLSQPSDDYNQEHGFFFAWPDMVRRDSCAAPSSVTSPVPAAYLNSCWHDYRFSGQAGQRRHHVSRIPLLHFAGFGYAATAAIFTDDTHSNGQSSPAATAEPTFRRPKSRTWLFLRLA